MSTSGSRAYHHGDLRAVLVQAALALLEENGEGALSLREAARRAGVSAMAPYRHFADKAALLAEAAAAGFAMLAKRLEAADQQEDPAEALAAQGEAYVVFACERPALFRLMFSPSPDGANVAMLAETSRAKRVLADRVAGMVPEAARADMILAHWSLVHGLAALIVDGRVDPRAGEPAAVARRIVRRFGGLPPG